jgi:hypothetical protein
MYSRDVILLAICNARKARLGDGDIVLLFEILNDTHHAVGTAITAVEQELEFRGRLDTDGAQGKDSLSLPALASVLRGCVH